MRRPPLASKTVLITGCSTGIGFATACALRDKGWTVVPTVRSDADFRTLELEKMNPVKLDITDEYSIQQAVTTTLSLTEGKLGGIVNNVGIGQMGAIEDLSLEAMRNQFEVNVFGMQALTNQLIPTFRQQGYGRIVNISSVLGRVSMPFAGIYSATKFAMEAMGDAMRIELIGTGIGVSLIEPGPIETAFRSSANNYADMYLTAGESRFADHYRTQLDEQRKMTTQNSRFMLPPEAVAKKVHHALNSRYPHRRYTVTFPATLGMLLRRFAPYALSDAILSRKLPRKT